MIFTPAQQSKYMRIPFRSKCRGFEGCDCGGLVWLIYKNELDIELPDWTELYSGTRIEHSLELEETVSTMLGENAVEVDLKDMRPFDVISFRIMNAPIHVGLAINNRQFMHIMEGRTNTAVERIDSPQWHKRVTGCFRHESMFSK